MDGGDVTVTIRFPQGPTIPMQHHSDNMEALLLKCKALDKAVQLGGDR